MIELVSLVLPIFLLIASGYASMRAAVVRPEFVQGLGAFVLNFALPALILVALMQQDLRQTLNWNYLLAYGVGSLAVFAMAFGVSRLMFGASLTRAAMIALGGSSSNSGFVGFPVASLAIGAPALTALPLSMLVENLLVIPLALALAEFGGSNGQGRPGVVVRETLLRLARTPLIIAIVVGALLSAIGVRLPEPIFRTFDMMAGAAIPCALFAVGGTLAALRIDAVGKDVPLIAVAKLILHPIAVSLFFWLVGGVPRGLMAAGIVMAAAPMLSVYPIFGARYGKEGMCAAALLVATAASTVTLVVVLALVGASSAAP